MSENITLSPEQLQDMLNRAAAAGAASVAPPPPPAPPEPFSMVRLEGVQDDVRVDSLAAPLPDKKFRDAWRLDGDVIVINMDAAKPVAQELVRQARKPELERLDVAVIRNLENGDPVEVLKRQKQALRDATKDQRLENAATPDELAKAVDAVIEDMRGL